MIKKVEELLINADPSSGIILDNGFLIRCYNTKDICTINMLVDNKDKSEYEIIKSHVERLKNVGLNPCYRVIHDSSYERLDAELVRYGFEITDRGAVMALRIENMERELFAFANFYEQGIWAADEMPPEWFDDYRDLMRMPSDYSRVFEDNLRRSPEERMFFGLVRDDRLIAMGYVTFIQEYMIINNIFVDERLRNLDYGKKILKSMLIKGLLRKCKFALCDIREEQEIALKMLAQEGFERAYSYQNRGKRIL